MVEGAAAEGDNSSTTADVWESAQLLRHAMEESLTSDAFLVGEALKNLAREPLPDSRSKDGPGLDWPGSSFGRLLPRLPEMRQRARVLLNCVPELEPGSEAPPDLDALYGLAADVADFADRWHFILFGLQFVLRDDRGIGIRGVLRGFISLADPDLPRLDTSPDLSWFPMALLENELGRMRAMRSSLSEWCDRLEFYSLQTADKMRLVAESKRAPVVSAAIDQVLREIASREPTRRKRGRPREFDATADEELVAEWQRASEAKVSREAFCTDKRISVDDLRAAQARVRVRRTRQGRAN